MPVGVGRAGRAQPVRDERHGDGGQRAAGGDLEEDVGQGVDALVDVADTPWPDGVGEDEHPRRSRRPGLAA